ncbi:MULTISPECIES: hypothetical protein [unclassified Frankia]|uniref:hypothetical protein n=1 Tax=unclassified Frankia TaxID=2632575 RepID=UPI002AD428F3|nr:MULTISPECIES: hypothetical protein [unclassified Frankia]
MSVGFAEKDEPVTGARRYIRRSTGQPPLAVGTPVACRDGVQLSTMRLRAAMKISG